MAKASLNLKQTLKVIKRFKFEELELAVFPIFPELVWNEIKSQLIKNHKSLTTDNILPLIEEEIIKKSITVKTLQNRLAVLEVTDVSRHYGKKIWYGHEFKGTTTLQFLSAQEIEENTEQNCDVYHMEMEVHAKKHNDILFVSIKEKPKKKSRKTIMPTYFALVPNETFFFASKKAVLKSTLMALVNTMGYQGVKQIKLMGRDIPSLVQMLLAKKTAQLQGQRIKEPLPFVEAPPTTTPLGLDFTQHKQREDYAEKCFGEKPPTFEVLKVKSFDQKWKHKDAVAKLPNDSVFIGIEFRSTNVPNFLKHLVKEGIMKTPLPPYAANILSLGRNDLTMEERRSSK